jgi:hypothetical protein
LTPFISFVVPVLPPGDATFGTVSSSGAAFLLLQFTAHTTAQANLIKQSNVNINPHQLAQAFIGL